MVKFNIPFIRNNSEFHYVHRDGPKEDSFQRSKTDSSIRSQSAPVEGAGIIGGWYCLVQVDGCYIWCLSYYIVLDQSIGWSSVETEQCRTS